MFPHQEKTAYIKENNPHRKPCCRGGGQLHLVGYFCYWTVWETPFSQQTWGLAFRFLRDNHCLNHKYDSYENIEVTAKSVDWWQKHSTSRSSSGCKLQQVVNKCVHVFLRENVWCPLSSWMWSGIWMRLCLPEESHHVSPLQTVRWLIWDTCKHLTAWVL